MNEPTKQFEARVIDGKILHNGDPLTAWMIGNATIKPDANGNYKPIKSDKIIKKIDGVITGLMTAAMVMAGAESTWNYEPGSLAL
jgi:phage terminase large subunit-like protein